MPYSVDDFVLKAQAFYSCPVLTCDTACTNLILIVQHLMSQHITVREGASLHAQVRPKAQASPTAQDQRADDPQEELAHMDIDEAEEELLERVPGEADPRLGQAPAQFACGVCNKRLSSKRSLKRHLLVHSTSHNNKESDEQQERKAIISCEWCSRSFSSRSNLKRHVTLIHPEQVHGAAAPRSPSDGQLEPHLAGEMPKSPDLCQECQAALKLPDSPWCSSCRTERSEERLQCRVCEKSFNRHSGLRQHEKDVHNLAPRRKDDPDPFHCTFCRLPYQTFEELELHVRSDHDDMFQCPRCSKSMTTARCMRRHLDTCQVSAAAAEGGQKAQAEGENSV